MCMLNKYKIYISLFYEQLICAYLQILCLKMEICSRPTICWLYDGRLFHTFCTSFKKLHYIFKQFVIK